MSVASPLQGSESSRLQLGEQERERRRYRDVALRSLGVPLRRHFGHLASMMKASVEQKPDLTPASLREFFNSGYVATVANLDCSKQSGSDLAWVDENANEFQHFTDALTQRLDRYAMYLEVELVTLMEGLLTSPFVAFVKQTRHLVHQRTVSPALFSHPTVGPLLGEYCAQFAALAEAFNAVEPEERLVVKPSDEIWRADVAPAIGSARKSP